MRRNYRRFAMIEIVPLFELKVLSCIVRAGMLRVVRVSEIVFIMI